MSRSNRLIIALASVLMDSLVFYFGAGIGIALAEDQPDGSTITISIS